MTPGTGRDRRPATILLGLAIVVCALVVYGLVSAGRRSTAPATAPAVGAAASTPTAASAGTPAQSATPAQSVTPASPAPSSSGASFSPSGTSAASPSASSVTAAPSPSGPLAVVDPSLLKVLPATVGGATVTEFPEAERQAVSDPDLGRNVSRVATAFVGDPAGSNWAYTAIVDVRPEARSEAFYRDWQESFDQSACERAGGVTGHTSAVIAGHDVERTACGQGVRTYHVRIVGTGLLVSISSLGDGKFGELEIAALP